MIVVHEGTDFSVTNLFQFDWDLKPTDDGKLKKIQVIQYIKKLFNFECNDYVTLVKGTEVIVICVVEGEQVAYKCEVFSPTKLIIKEKLNININDTLKKLKNGSNTR